IHSARIRLFGIDAPELGACGDPGIRDLMTTALPTFWIVIVGQQEVGRGERGEIGSSFLLVSTLCGKLGSVQDRSTTCLLVSPSCCCHLRERAVLAWGGVVLLLKGGR